MGRNASGVYSLPSGSTVVNGDTSDATDLNTPLQDLESDANTVRPIVAGGTGASSASAARSALGVQASDPGLTSIAGLTTAADKGIYTTASDVYATFDLTSAGRALLDDADASAQRTTLGLGALAVEASVTTSQIAAATLVTESEGISSNDNDTTIPTSAAVKDYADNRAASFAILAAEYSSGTTPGTMSNGSWGVIPVNTERHDNIGVSISSNQITFATAGTYHIRATLTARPSTGDSRGQLRVYNATSASAVAYGNSVRARVESPLALVLESVITVSASDAIQIEGYATAANVDFYADNNFGTTEVGLQVYIQKG